MNNKKRVTELKPQPKKCVACEHKLVQKTANIWVCSDHRCRMMYWYEKEVRDEK